jgi:hypothetical protein
MVAGTCVGCNEIISWIVVGEEVLDDGGFCDERSSSAGTYGAIG